MDDHGLGGRKSLRRSQPGFAGLAPISPPALRTSRSIGSMSANVVSRDPSDSGGPVLNATSESISNDITRPPSAARSWQSDFPHLMNIYAGNLHDSPAQETQDNGPPGTVVDVVRRLRTLRQEMGQHNADRAVHAIRETTVAVRDGRIHTGRDLFANCRSTSVPSKQPDSVRIKFKQHKRHKKDCPEEIHVPFPINSSKDRAPRYQFHHIEIEKNIITPRAMRDFVPHLRDVDEAQEKEYEAWVQELEDTDKKLGFLTMSREQKCIMTLQSEKAALLSLYLDYWVEELAIPGCTMTTLFRLFGPDENEEGGVPRHPDLQNRAELTEQETQATNMFMEAFHKVFGEGPLEKRIDLRQVLISCRTTDTILDSKPTARDDLAEDFEDEDEQTEATLGSYSILGCQICHQQSCEHGDYDAQNYKQYFTAKLPDLLKRRRMERGGDPLPVDRDLTVPCEHEKSALAHCPPNGMSVLSSTWTDKQRAVLRSLWVTLLEFDEFEDSPRCEIASWLNRPCREVRSELLRMDIKLPTAPRPSAQPIKALAWYDRYKKSLLGNWGDHLKVHAYNKRETVDPCAHDGPCRKGECPCIDKGLLCEKFCGCTLECCAYKFNGCACHSRGKNCMTKQKDKPCICLLLNRECDPSLCGSCGIKEDTLQQLLSDKGSVLPRARCQNSDLQRGQEKDVVVGRSQLQGVGYGLYTAESIAQDEFVLEYKGEIITQDEGTRREARQGFDEPAPVSFNFQLLDTEGVWIDAAIYGNLSRYINHAPEKDRWGCNIKPKIVYVNGEFRIKFIAIRDIAVGEELFFNYGEYFPNLTEKLLNDTPVVEEARRRKPRTQQRDGQTKRGPGRPRRQDKVEQPARRQSDRPSRLRRLQDSSDEAEESVVDADDEEQPSPVTRLSRKRKRGADLDSSQEDYVPNGHRPSSEAGDDDESRSKNGDSRSTAAARLRARLKQNAQKSIQPSSPKPAVKPKGKRGGARPGSGRPRKHPLPVPKDPAAGKASPAVTRTANASSPVANHSTPTLRRRSSPDHPRSSTQRSGRRSRLARSVRAVPDSEDESVAVGEGSSDVEGARNEEGHAGTQSKLEDRATRNRRPPAKFRGEDVWRGRSSSR